MDWYFSFITCLLLALNLISLCKGQIKSPGDLQKNVKLLPTAQYLQYCDLNTKCDSSKFLTCGGNNKCKCYDDLTYDFEKRICPNTEDLQKNVRALPIGQQFDQFCDLNSKCDRSKFLTCGGNSRCRCYDDLTYDATQKICALRNDDPCLPPPNGVFKCLTNAACTNGTCSCNRNYYNNNFGVCTLQANYNESCSDFNPIIPCSSYQGLQCTAGKCLCNSLNSTYSLENSQCVGKTGNPCINSKCIPGAICTSSNMCVCNPEETYPGVGGDCLLKKPELSSCTEDIECQKSLNCISGVCGCPSRDTALDTSSVWNITTRRFNTERITKCVGLANRPCVDGLCVSNANCVYTSQFQFVAGNLNGTCSCYQGNRTENNFCRVDFGQSCTSGKGCPNGLVCRDNVCSCEYPFNQMYDSATKTCKSKIRGPCRKSQDCNDNGVCSYIAGSITPPTTGHCTCPSGFIENAEGSCDIEFGNACTVMNNVNSLNAAKCDRVAKLSCINNLCVCSDKFYEYDRDQRKCKGFVGALCNADKSTSDCVTDALCLHPFSKTSNPAESDRLWSDDKINTPTLISRIGRCKCRDTTVETEDYKCK